MDGKDGLILWTLGGAGVLLLYSAYANKSPKTVLAATLGTAPAVPNTRETADGGTVPGSAGTHRETADGGPVPGSGSGYHAGTFDGTGTQYLFDANGVVAGVVPGPYQSSSATYIPPAGVINA